ncbi:oxidoreductase [Halioglobus japonicus]|uniref:NAD(P)-dependent oxidoreductase n=1 Tax=Halioglobus japonicus TaxID=930805 RepID=A0AAP8MEV1_9GAMM|nr:NAD(P)-dependent oxidoreductase [Halioglobus japonicus]AQA18485.1 oxidoreductase [Halioglobus japonicus]PLW86503.1 NAD(P)-dependent oxidoreductase [Halioglobus japonicus]GHD12516.1 oxidoreductase [Halioglobus japonicus]
MKLAFIGLGVMGYPMAGHLQRAGHEVTVYNRTVSKARDWVDEYGGAMALTPAAAATEANQVFVCVGNDDDVRSVIYGDEGVLAGLASGAVIVDHTTASAELARELAAAAAEQGIGFLDAPVSGGQGGAENGVLTVMVGGEAETFAMAESVLQCYARCVRLLGACGSGQLAKMVNQICIAGVVQGLAEALEFSEQAGLDSAGVVEVISQGAAQSWQMENRYQTMLAGEYEHGFAVDWMRKDLGMVLAEASRMGLELPITQIVDGYYADVQGMGGGRWDTSSLFARMRERSK